MALATFKDLCVDAVEPDVLGPFWAEVLQRTWEPGDDGDGRIVGPTPQHTLWVNRVPEPKSVKHRVHFDIYAATLDELRRLGSSEAPGWPDFPRWTVMADPEGGEYCAFLRQDVPAERLHGLVVDSAAPAAQARWWSGLVGGSVTDHPEGYSTVAGVPGMPISTLDFVPVPEPKSAKNRIHVDVVADAVPPILEAGATMREPRGGDRRWDVLADPEGNELCVFVRGRDV
jgi:Glyoxalase-like domain